MAFQYEISFAWVLKLCSFLFWSWSYFYLLNKAPNHSLEWYTRMVTLLHGTVATGVGLWQCNLPTLSQCTLTMKMTYSHYLLMLWSWGYFAFDLLWCLIYWTNNYVILAHHFCALYAVNLYMDKDFTGCTFACTLALMEITNPFLQTRWLLRDAGYGNTIIFKVVEVTYLVMFITLRGIVCTYLIYKILNSDFFDMGEKLVSLALYFVSFVFIYEILGYVAYKYKTHISVLHDYYQQVTCYQHITHAVLKYLKLQQPAVNCS